MSHLAYWCINWILFYDFWQRLHKNESHSSTDCTSMAQFTRPAVTSIMSGFGQNPLLTLNSYIKFFVMLIMLILCNIKQLGLSWKPVIMCNKLNISHICNPLTHFVHKQSFHNQPNTSETMKKTYIWAIYRCWWSLLQRSLPTMMP